MDRFKVRVMSDLYKQMALGMIELDPELARRVCSAVEATGADRGRLVQWAEHLADLLYRNDYEIALGNDCVERITALNPDDALLALDELRDVLEIGEAEVVKVTVVRKALYFRPSEGEN
jgi:hypothetical protein